MAHNNKFLSLPVVKPYLEALQYQSKCVATNQLFHRHYDVRRISIVTNNKHTCMRKVLPEVCIKVFISQYLQTV